MDGGYHMNYIHPFYTMAIPLLHPGWVGFYLGSSPGCLAAVVVTYCPSRMVEYPKSWVTQPGCRSGIATVYVLCSPSILLDIATERRREHCRQRAPFLTVEKLAALVPDFLPSLPLPNDGETRSRHFQPSCCSYRRSSLVPQPPLSFT